MKLFEKRYRIVEVVKGDGRSEFYPQSRKWYTIWRQFEQNHSNEPVEYGSLKRAEKFIFDLTMSDRSRKTVNTKTHEFDAVFYKLKSKGQDTNENTSAPN